MSQAWIEMSRGSLAAQASSSSAKAWSFSARAAWRYGRQHRRDVPPGRLGSQPLQQPARLLAVAAPPRRRRRSRPASTDLRRRSRERVRGAATPPRRRPRSKWNSASSRWDRASWGSSSKARFHCARASSSWPVADELARGAAVHRCSRADPAPAPAAAGPGSPRSGRARAGTSRTRDGRWWCSGRSRSRCRNSASAPLQSHSSTRADGERGAGVTEPGVQLQRASCRGLLLREPFAGGT